MSHVREAGETGETGEGAHDAWHQGSTRHLDIAYRVADVVPTIWKNPCLVLHTTGSTELPKPISWKLEILSTYEAWRIIPSVDGYVPTTEV